MSDIIVPPIGTKVEVLSRYTLPWMNEYRRPTVGVVAHSNSWDKPGTFRLIGTGGIGEAVVSLDRLEYLKIIKDSTTSTTAAKSEVSSFEIKGSQGDIYIVTLDGDKAKCTCPAGSHGRVCKHIKMAREEHHS
jgi:hypothetical protein